MNQSTDVVYTAKTHTVGARANGTVRSSDGQLDLQLSTPGAGRPGANPEQLFAAGWSACFEGAMGIAARQLGHKLPAEVAIDAEVDLCRAEEGFFLQARLSVSVPGLDHDVAAAIVQAAHLTCPYSKAIRGNIDVEINLV